MRVTVDQSWKFMRSNPEIKDLMIQGFQNTGPIRKSRVRAVDEETKVFIKIWRSVQGAEIRMILERDLGAHAGVECAARLYFSELRKEMEKCEKEI